MKAKFHSLLAGLLLFLIPAAFADQQDFGGHIVHYSVVNSTFLDPAIAQQYGIVRGARNAFLNIAVLNSGTGRPVAATLTGFRENLLRQRADIDFIEVREGEAVYYIGQFEFSNMENLRFEVEILPEGAASPYSLSWTSQLYVN